MDFNSLEWGAYKALLHPESDKPKAPAKSKANSSEVEDEAGSKHKGKMLGIDASVQTIEAAFINDDDSDIDVDEDLEGNEQGGADKVVQTLTVSISPKKRIRSKFPAISLKHVSRGQGQGQGQENALNSPQPNITAVGHPHVPPQPVSTDSSLGALGVSVGQKPLTYPPQKVNVVRSKEYAEQVQRELLLRKMQRMQGI